MKVPALPRFQTLTIVAAVGVLALPALGQAYTEEQQRLCNDDAMRLCGEFVPDVDRITACMHKQRALLSKECKSVFGRRHFPVPRGQGSRQQ